MDQTVTASRLETLIACEPRVPLSAGWLDRPARASAPGRVVASGATPSRSPSRAGSGLGHGRASRLSRARQAIVSLPASPRRARGRPSEVDRRVVVLGANSADVAEPVAVVVLGRSLERIGKRPRLPLVRPVVGLQAVRFPEPGDGGV